MQRNLIVYRKIISNIIKTQDKLTEKNLKLSPNNKKIDFLENRLPLPGQLAGREKRPMLKMVFLSVRTVSLTHWVHHPHALEEGAWVTGPPRLSIISRRAHWASHADIITRARERHRSSGVDGQDSASQQFFCHVNGHNGASISRQQQQHMRTSIFSVGIQACRRHQSIYLSSGELLTHTACCN